LLLLLLLLLLLFCIFNSVAGITSTCGAICPSTVFTFMHFSNTNELCPFSLFPLDDDDDEQGNK
jgi:hypothetical protein